MSKINKENLGLKEREQHIIKKKAVNLNLESDISLYLW